MDFTIRKCRKVSIDGVTGVYKQVYSGRITPKGLRRKGLSLDRDKTVTVSEN